MTAGARDWGEVVDRAVAALVAVSVCAYMALVVHDFFRYIDRYPYWSFDDGLALVMQTLATHGRFGDIGYPVQPPFDQPRHTAFFNYGPWYFYLGAALIWLFGFSVKLLRAIHVGVLVTVVVVSRLWFQRLAGVVAAACFALGIFYCLDTVQWPMIRPDILVSLFAVLFVVAAGVAMKRPTPWTWFLAGLTAACGALTHLVAGSLVVSSVALLGIAGRRERPGSRALSFWFGGLAAGIALAGLMFYASFGFKVGEHLALLLNYRAVTAPRFEAQAAAGFVPVLRTHLSNSFGALDVQAQRVIAAGIVLAIILELTALLSSASHRTLVHSCLTPPLVALLLYMLSLGGYTNVHTGYGLLAQVLGFWSVAAALYVVLTSTAGVSGRALPVIAGMLVVGLAVVQVRHKLSSENERVRLASTWVRIPEYLDRIVEPLPRGAYAWGAHQFGVAGPDRVQIVALDVAMRVAAAKPVASRQEIAPDYLVWSGQESRDGTLLVLDGKPNQLDALESLLPGRAYAANRLVAGAPYGVTRIYERVDMARTAPALLPSVAAWEASADQWLRGTSASQPAAFAPAAPLCFDVVRRGHLTRRCADRTTAAPMVDGWYLVRVTLRTGLGAADRVVAVASTHSVAQPIGDLPPPADFAFYAATDTVVDLLYRHTGGPLLVGQFDRSESAAVADVTVYPLTAAPDFSTDRDPRTPLPGVDAWEPDTTHGVRASREGAGLRVDGNDSAAGYQLMSPAISVGPGAEIVLRLDATIEQGSVCAGVLTGDQSRWVMPPADLAPAYRFNAPASGAVRVVFANCASGPVATRSRFTLRGGALSTRAHTLMIDRLMEGWTPSSNAAPR